MYLMTVLRDAYIFMKTPVSILLRVVNKAVVLAPADFLEEELLEIS